MAGLTDRQWNELVEEFALENSDKDLSPGEEITAWNKFLEEQAGRFEKKNVENYERDVLAAGPEQKQEIKRKRERKEVQVKQEDEHNFNWKKARSVKNLVGSQPAWWPLFHLDDVKASEYKVRERLILQIALPPGKTNPEKQQCNEQDECTDNKDIEVYLTGDIEYKVQKSHLLGEQGTLYRMKPVSVEVDPPQFKEAITTMYVPEKKAFNVEIVYWLAVPYNLLSATVFITHANKDAQQVQDDIGEENRDPSTRLAEYSVVAIKRQKRNTNDRPQSKIKVRVTREEGRDYNEKELRKKIERDIARREFRYFTNNRYDPFTRFRRTF
jgi:hypothetical protein